MIRRLLSILPLLLVPCLCSAAPALRALAWDEEVAARKLALVRGESMRELANLHPTKRSDGVKLSGEGPLLLRALDRNAPDGEPVQRVIPLSESVTHPLLVLLPDPADATGIRVIVFDDNPAGFRWGAYRFLNATPRELAVRLERKTVRVPPGWKPVDLDLGGATRGIGALLGLPGAKEPLYSAVWEYDTGVRTLCFLVPGTDPRSSPVGIKAVPENRRSTETSDP